MTIKHEFSYTSQELLYDVFIWNINFSSNFIMNFFKIKSNHESLKAKTNEITNHTQTHIIRDSWYIYYVLEICIIIITARPPIILFLIFFYYLEKQSRIFYYIIYVYSRTHTHVFPFHSIGSNKTFNNNIVSLFAADCAGKWAVLHYKDIL